MQSTVTENLNSTEPSIESPSVGDLNDLIVGCVVNSVFSFTAFTGNGLVLGTIWKTPSLHSPSHVLLFGLALSDFGVGFIVQPLYVTCSLLEIMKQKYLLVVWTTYRVTQAIFVSATVLTLTAVSIDRFLALYLHLRYTAVVKANRVVITLLTIWTTSVAFALTLIANNDLHRALCIFVISSSLLVTSSVYVMIFRIARHHQNQIRDQVHINGDEKRHRNATVSMFVVFLLLCACYLPYLCVRIAIKHARWQFKIVRLAVSWSGVLVYINSSLNPLVYCWRMRDLRAAMKNFAKNHLFCND